MDMETFSSFRKLWGRIEQDLEPSTYTIEIEDSKLLISLNFKKITISTFLILTNP